MTCTNTTIITRHTLVWQSIKFAVFSLSGYRYVGDDGTNRPEILQDATYRSWRGLLPQIRNFGPKF